MANLPNPQLYDHVAIATSAVMTQVLLRSVREKVDHCRNVVIFQLCYCIHYYLGLAKLGAMFCVGTTNSQGCEVRLTGRLTQPGAGSQAMSW